MAAVAWRVMGLVAAAEPNFAPGPAILVCQTFNLQSSTQERSSHLVTPCAGSAGGSGRSVAATACTCRYSLEIVHAD